MYIYIYICMARDALKLVRRMWPHRSARGMRARPERALLGYHGRVLVSTRVQELKSPPPVGPGADKSRFGGPGDRLPGHPRRWRVLLHDGICPSAVSIALSGVPAKTYIYIYIYMHIMIILIIMKITIMIIMDVAGQHAHELRHQAAYMCV